MSSERTRRGLAVMAILAALTACDGGIELATQDIRSRLQEIDIEETLDGLTDCGQLSDAFISVVQRAADSIDNLDDTTQISVPISDLRETVDELAVSRYYEIAEQLGCARIQMQLETIDRLRDLEADTASGDIFLEEVMAEVQLPTP